MSLSIEATSSPERLQNHRIAIATTSFYKEWSMSPEGENNADQIRGSLALETIRTAKAMRFQIVVIDGGSSRDFRNELDKLGVKVFDQKEKGMGPSRRQAFNEASSLSGAEAICWTEPEKVSMVLNLEAAAKPVLEGKADIVIPARTEEGFATYPDQQVKSEKKLNHLFSTVLRLTDLLPKDKDDLDVSFGPRIFKNNPQVLSIFTHQYKLKEGSRMAQEIKPDTYSNATFFPIMLALEKGLKVLSVEVPYTHPEAQTEFETGNPDFEEKRIKQRKDIVGGAIELARYLINNPRKLSDLVE